MPRKSGLTVRQHEREGIAAPVPVEFSICSEHSTQLHFSPRSSAMSAHGIRGRATDISSGGMGLECRQFVPRMSEGTVRILVPDPIAVGPDGSPVLEVGFEHQVKVRRVYLTGREPTYALGLAFVNPAADIDQRVTALLKRIHAWHEPLGQSGAKGAANA
ncbi:MAG: hypothetical protein L0219_16265 [Phycisphaerales bacterium]|nr:hypothetical protein [Phycisphaerales bacterium]